MFLTLGYGDIERRYTYQMFSFMCFHVTISYIRLKTFRFSGPPGHPVYSFVLFWNAVNRYFLLVLLRLTTRSVKKEGVGYKKIWPRGLMTSWLCMLWLIVCCFNFLGNFTGIPVIMPYLVSDPTTNLSTGFVIPVRRMLPLNDRGRHRHPN